MDPWSRESGDLRLVDRPAQALRRKLGTAKGRHQSVAERLVPRGKHCAQLIPNRVAVLITGNAVDVNGVVSARGVVNSGSIETRGGTDTVQGDAIALGRRSAEAIGILKRAQHR